MTATTAPRTRFETSMSVRGENRSLKAPPTSMKTARGMAAVMRTVPSARPEPVSCSASQASATKWNWSPSTLIVSPANTSR